MKTIAQIASEIGVSRQAVYKKIKQEPLSTGLQTLMSTKGNTVYIDDSGENLIKSAFNKEALSSDAVNQMSTIVNEYIKSLQERADFLEKQILVKDEQIRELNARLTESNTALVTAQQSAQAAQALHAGTMQKQLADGDTPVNTVVEPLRKGFFQKFLKKAVH